MNNPKKPPSTPLTTPDGEVRAWACGVCARVGAVHGTLAPPTAKDRAWAAKSSREDADGCCVCRNCNAVGADVWPRECPACREKREAEWEASRPAAEAKAANEERARDETYAAALDKVAAKALGEAMSDISEDCYCAGWMSGLEFSLWEFLTNGPGEWGMGTVSADDLRVLRTLSEKCGGWIAWREDAGQVFVPLVNWLSMFDAEQERAKAWLAAYEANQAAQKTGDAS